MDTNIPYKLQNLHANLRLRITLGHTPITLSSWTVSTMPKANARLCACGCGTMISDKRTQRQHLLGKGPSYVHVHHHLQATQIIHKDIPARSNSLSQSPTPSRSPSPHYSVDKTPFAADYDADYPSATESDVEAAVDGADKASLDLGSGNRDRWRRVTVEEIQDEEAYGSDGAGDTEEEDYNQEWDHDAELEEEFLRESGWDHDKIEDAFRTHFEEETSRIRTFFVLSGFTHRVAADSSLH